MKGKSKRKNTHFRQTAKEFRSQKQNQIYEHFNKNLPFKIYNFSKEQFVIHLSKLKREFNKVRFKLPRSAQKKES
jgi:hypothetical protein